MQFILGIVCHLGGVTLYVALIMDYQRKTIMEAFECNFRGLYETPIFSESVGEGFISISLILPIKSYGDFNVTDLLLWAIPIGL